jgi:hypothetical protein
MSFNACATIPQSRHLVLLPTTTSINLSTQHSLSGHFASLLGYLWASLQTTIPRHCIVKNSGLILHSRLRPPTSLRFCFQLRDVETPHRNQVTLDGHNLQTLLDPRAKTPAVYELRNNPVIPQPVKPTLVTTKPDLDAPLCRTDLLLDDTSSWLQTASGTG